jgi:nitric oxide reductase NorD protein
MSQSPLNAHEIEERLDELLWAALSSRRTAASAARELAALSRDAQEFVLHWVRVIEQTNAESAYQFASHARKALACLGDTRDVERWIIHAMDVYDRSGVYRAMDVFRNVEGFAEQARMREAGVLLEDVLGVLGGFVRGLSGRSLKLEAAGESHTDTETLFLPEVVSTFGDRDTNFRLYKATAVYLWAQTRFGTWRVRLSEVFTRYRDPERACGLFQALEGLRLDGRIARELPGVHRDMRGLSALLDQPLCPPGWEAYDRRLSAADATVQDTLELLASVYERGAPAPDAACFQGRLFPDRTEEVIARRLAEEKAGFRLALLRLEQELAGQRREAAEGDEREAPEGVPAFKLRQVTPEGEGEGLRFELTLGDTPIEPPEDVKGLMESIIQDLGEIPPDYLVPAGEGTYRPRDLQRDEDLAADVWKGTYHEKGAHLYNEWDFRRQHYRKEWCVLRELEVTPKPDGFVSRTLIRYAHHLMRLRRTFEALRGEDKRLRKEPIGDEVDIDALVEARADARSGLEMSDRLFTRLDKVERNIAVMFMVDMSGSTQGWVNQATRESLILLCEALGHLGDRYAIYGFSGMTRKRCEVYRIKRFEDAYDNAVQARIAAIEPKDYTRMGVAIRHLSRLLNGVEAKTRILITLSDGKPDDYGGEYRGEYGIEDTRRALIEAKREGVHPFCITIDREGQDYLPHMYGPVSYTIVDAVEKLPYKVSDIYRRLTT